MSAEREGLERGARKLHELETREGCATVEWSDMPEQHRDMYRKDAAEVLALLDGGERQGPVAWHVRYADREYWVHHHMGATAPDVTEGLEFRAVYASPVGRTPVSEGVER